LADLYATTVTYISAAETVLESGDQHFIYRTEYGLSAPLLEAAAKVRGRVKLMKALRSASPSDLATVGAAVGVDRVFDSMIVPSL
jgi:hypothetical protein